MKPSPFARKIICPVPYKPWKEAVLNNFSNEKTGPGSQAEEVTRLSALLSDEPNSGTWGDADLPSMLRHQLQTSLAGELDNGTREADELLKSASLSGIHVFEDLLFKEGAPRPLLLCAKDHFKPHAGDGSLLHAHERLAYVLYLSCIAAGQRRGYAPISSLSNVKLVHAFGWAIELPWMSPDIRTLLEGALEASRRALSVE